MFGILKHFGLVKAKQAAEAIDEVLAKDTEAYIQADYNRLYEQFTNLTKEVAAARIEYERELKEADVAQSHYQKRIDAVKHLQTQYETAPSTELEEALTILLDEIDTLKPDVDREREEAVLAKETLDELESLAKEMGNNLTTLQSNIKKAELELKKSEASKELAERREERAVVVAGLRQNNYGFSKAMEKLNKAAEKNKIETEAANSRAALLGGAAKSKGNAIVEAALAGTAKPSTSIADRLKNL